MPEYVSLGTGVLGVRDAVDRVGFVVGQHERAIRGHDRVNRPAPHTAVAGPTCSEVLYHLSTQRRIRLIVLEVDKYQLIARGHAPVPTAVESHEQAARILLRELLPVVEGQAE